MSNKKITNPNHQGSNSNSNKKLWKAVGKQAETKQEIYHVQRKKLKSKESELSEILSEDMKINVVGPISKQSSTGSPIHFQQSFQRQKQKVKQKIKDVKQQQKQKSKQVKRPSPLIIKKPEHLEKLQKQMEISKQLKQTKNYSQNITKYELKDKIKQSQQNIGISIKNAMFFNESDELVSPIYPKSPFHHKKIKNQNSPRQSQNNNQDQNQKNGNNSIIKLQGLLPSMSGVSRIKQFDETFDEMYLNNISKIMLKKKQTKSGQMAQLEMLFQEQYKKKALLSQKIVKKDQLKFKIRIQAKSIQTKIIEYKTNYKRLIQYFHQQLQKFKTKQKETFSQFNIIIQDYIKKINENQLNVKHKQSMTVNQLQQALRKKQKHLDQSQKKIFTLTNQKNSFQRKIKELELINTTSKDQLISYNSKIKSQQNTNIQLKLQLQKQKSRIVSLKNDLNQKENLLRQYRNSSDISSENLLVKNKNLKNQLQELQFQHNKIKNQRQMLKTQLHKNIQLYHQEIRQAQKMIQQMKNQQYRSNNQLKSEMNDLIRQNERLKQSNTELALKMKDKNFQYYKKIEQFDKLLAQIQKETQLIALKKHQKQEDIQKKQAQLIRRENKLLQEIDSIRLQKNELQCAVQLYKKNIMLLQKKENNISHKYNEIVQIQNSAKSAWYERYYKLFSTNNNEEANLKKNHIQKQQKQGNIRSSPRSPIENFSAKKSLLQTQLKKQTISQRLYQISSEKQIRKELSPRNNNSKPLSPRIRINQMRSDGWSSVLKPQNGRRTSGIINNFRDSSKNTSNTKRQIYSSPNTKRQTKDNNSNPDKYIYSDYGILSSKLQQVKQSIRSQIGQIKFE